MSNPSILQLNVPEPSYINYLDADSPAAQTQPQTKIRKITQLQNFSRDQKGHKVVDKSVISSTFLQLG